MGNISRFIKWIILVCVAVVLTFCIAYAADDSTNNAQGPCIIVSSVRARPSGYVYVDICMENNPGIAAMNIQLGYDSDVFEIVEVIDGGILGDEYHGTDSLSIKKNPYTLQWVNATSEDDFTEDGVLASLKLKVKSNAPLGEYNLSLSYEDNNIVNKNLKSVDFDIQNGTVNVVKVKLGDPNCDGKIGTVDCMYLLRYIAKWKQTDTLEPLAFDVNNDGKITLADGIILLRYVAKWSGYETLPYGSTEIDNEAAKALVSEDFIDPITEWDKYDSLITRIKSSTDSAIRASMMHQAESILMASNCVLPLYYYNDVYLQKDYVTGIYSTAFSTKYFMYAKMSNGSKTLKLNLASEPDYLDPALNSSVDGACLAVNSFSGLYTYGADGKTAPACAEGYVLSADGLTYTVTLKSGLKWSDGTALTAADFEYSWKRAADINTAADYQYMYSGFEGYSDSTSSAINVKAIDDVTLQFVLNAPCAYMEDLMAFPTFYPVQKTCVEAQATAQNPGAWCQEAGFVSNGAYVCTGWEHNIGMTYEKNPYWYDADNVTVEKLEFMLSGDDTAIYAAYNEGDIDFADTVPADEISSLKSNSEFYIVDELGTYYAAFNCKSAIFNGKTPEQAACMRKAISILIDRDYLCENIGQTGQVAADSFIPIGMADGNGGLFKSASTVGYYDAYAINNDKDAVIAEAIELLEAAGYKFTNGKLDSSAPLQLTYLTNTSSGHIAVAESIQQDLKQVGIELTIEQQDWNVFLENRKNGNFDIARGGWVADYNDPINMLEIFGTNHGNNDCQFGR